jgi:hypothetical protein
MNKVDSYQLPVFSKEYQQLFPLANNSCQLTTVNWKLV